MNLKELFRIQKELDYKILMEHKLEGVNLIAPKILALQVELGELANETRCFKYWSKKKPSEKPVILEEYVDCLHFILSIGLEKGYLSITTELDLLEGTLVEQFQRVYTEISRFEAEGLEKQYIGLWESFMALGRGLGFTFVEIEEAYLFKNEINHKRQAEGY